MFDFGTMLKSQGAKVELAFRGFLKIWKVFPKWHKMSWPLEVMESSDSVAILIADSVGILTVIQPRVAMTTLDNPDASFEEAAAGRFDKAPDSVVLALSEITQETGLSVRERDLKVLNGGVPLALNPGVVTERMYLYEVTLRGDVLKSLIGQTHGVAEEGEQITIGFIPYKDLLSGKHVIHDMKLFALIWWYMSHKKQLTLFWWKITGRLK